MILGMRGHDFGKMQPAALADAISQYGFRATQLAFAKCFEGPAEQYMTPEALASIRETFAARDIAIPVLGSYVSASDADDAVREAAKEKYAAALRASVTLGAGCVGTETTHFRADESEREAAYGRLLDFAKHVAAAAEDCGAIAAIEPVALHTLNTPELTRRLLDDVHSPNLKVILDTANLVTPQTTAPEAQLEIFERCIACFGGDVVALHIKDGVFDAEGKWQNRPLGEGVMDWARLFPRLRQHFDNLCATREGVFPGMAAEELATMRRWHEG